MTGVVCSRSVFLEVSLEYWLLLRWFNGDKDVALVCSWLSYYVQLAYILKFIIDSSHGISVWYKCNAPRVVFTNYDKKKCWWSSQSSREWACHADTAKKNWEKDDWDEIRCIITVMLVHVSRDVGKLARCASMAACNPIGTSRLVIPSESWSESIKHRHPWWPSFGRYTVFFKRIHMGIHDLDLLLLLRFGGISKLNGKGMDVISGPATTVRRRFTSSGKYELFWARMCLYLEDLWVSFILH